MDWSSILTESAITAVVFATIWFAWTTYSNRKNRDALLECENKARAERGMPEMSVGEFVRELRKKVVLATLLTTLLFLAGATTARVVLDLLWPRG